MISFVGVFHPYQAYIRTRLVRFTGVHQIPTGSKRSDFHEKYLVAQPQLEGRSQVLEGWLTSPNEEIWSWRILKMKKFEVEEYEVEKNWQNFEVKEKVEIWILVWNWRLLWSWSYMYLKFEVWIWKKKNILSERWGSQPIGVVPTGNRE